MKLTDYGYWTHITRPDQEDLWLRGHQTMDQIVKIIPHYDASEFYTNHLCHGWTLSAALSQRNTRAAKFYIDHPKFT